MLAGVTMHRDNAVQLERKVCRDTLSLIHNDPLLGGLPVVCVTEGAPGYEASYIVKHITKYAQEVNMTIHFLREMPNNDVGVLKNKYSTDLYRYCLETALENKILCYRDKLATVSPDATPKQELDRLGEMIRSYHRDPKTGKVTSKVEGTPDDILAAVNQLLFWANVFWKSPKYIQMRNSIIRRSGTDFPFPLVAFRESLQRIQPYKKT